MKKKSALLIKIVLVVALLFTSMLSVMATEDGVTIIFTHDLHSSFLPFNTLQQGDIISKGGFARIKTLINNEKSNDPLVVDAGDFSMGTLFQTIYTTEASELRMLGNLGFDATTFGNHEFDFRTSGLSEMLDAAVLSGDPLPQILVSNISFPLDANGKLTPELMGLKNSFAQAKVEEYLIVVKNGRKIGIFGLMGKDAVNVAPTAEVEFEDNVLAAQRMVKQLKAAGAEMIVALSHSGTNKDASKSEDEILAKKVPEIDLIISGHTHSTLEKPLIVGNTVIVSASAYGQFLGKISLLSDENGRWKVKDYQLAPITPSIPAENGAVEKIASFKRKVQDRFLNQYNYNFDQVLAKSPFSFQTLAELDAQNAESPLGNLITDAYIFAVKRAEAEKYEEIAAAVVPRGVIRGSLVAGDITVSDVFQMSSLGIGKDKIPGYPLVSIYLTGEELKNVAEVNASVTNIMSDAQLYTAGLQYTFNPNRLIFNKVTSAELVTERGMEALEANKLYRVVGGLYSCQMLGAVQAKTFGIISLVPKDQAGKPISDFEDHIIYQQGKEIKEWISLANYLESFKKENGNGIIPAYYNETHGRKNVLNDQSLVAFMSNPNSFAIKVYAVLILVVLVLVWLIYRIATHKKRRLLTQAKAKSIKQTKFNGTK